MFLIFYYSPLFSSEIELILVLIKIVIALAIGLEVFNLLSPRTTSLSIYRLGGYLIYSNREPEYIPRVPWLLPILLYSLKLGSKPLLLILRIGLLKY